MTTDPSLNGADAAKMESEAAQSHSEMAGEAEEEGYSDPEGYNKPYLAQEMEEEWEMSEGSYYSDPYSNPEMEREMYEGEHYSNPYSQPEMEWEMHEGQHYSDPYSHPEMYGGQHYSNSYSQPEMEWEMHEGQHYSDPYAHPEMEGEMYETDPFIPVIAKIAIRLIPTAGRIGRNLMRSLKQHPSQPTGRSPQHITSLFQQLAKAFVQGERETAAVEAHLFGNNEFEMELAPHEMAQQATLAEVLAAEAAHTESESEAQTMLGAALPISMRVMGGGINIHRLLPTLLKVNTCLLLGLHRRGREGRQLIRVMPKIQRNTISSLKAIVHSGRPVTPTVVAQTMAGHAARVLTTPHVLRQALIRNMFLRQQTVGSGSSSPRLRTEGVRPGMRPPAGMDGARSRMRPVWTDGARPDMRPPAGMNGARSGMYSPGGTKGARPGTRPPAWANGTRPGTRSPAATQGAAPDPYPARGTGSSSPSANP